MSDDNVVKTNFRVSGKTKPGNEKVKSSTRPEELGPHGRMTVEEALQYMLRSLPKNIIISYNYEKPNGDTGFGIVSSELTNAEALFLMEKCKQVFLGDCYESD